MSKRSLMTPLNFSLSYGFLIFSSKAIVSSKASRSPLSVSRSCLLSIFSAFHLVQLLASFITFLKASIPFALSSSSGSLYPSGIMATKVLIPFLHRRSIALSVPFNPDGSLSNARINLFSPYFMMFSTCFSLRCAFPVAITPLTPFCVGIRASKNPSTTIISFSPFACHIKKGVFFIPSAFVKGLYFSFSFSPSLSCLINLP
ncbi:hypothetical protein ES703_33100 [subsurface metagenome]